MQHLARGDPPHAAVSHCVISKYEQGGTGKTDYHCDYDNACKDMGTSNSETGVMVVRNINLREPVIIKNGVMGVRLVNIREPVIIRMT